jgi:hypothetical protein
MKRNRVWGRVAIVALAVLLLGVGGCARWDALMRADQIEREAKAGEARALKRQSEEYFLIGMEYFSLARTAEKAGDAVRAKDCATKASLYNTLAKGLAREAEEARMEPASASAPATPRANGPAAAPPSPVAPAPVGASLAPQPVAAPSAPGAAVPAPAQRAAPASTANVPLPDLPPGFRGADATRSRP